MSLVGGKTPPKSQNPNFCEILNLSNVVATLKKKENQIRFWVIVNFTLIDC